ncbi:atp-dependent dna helicase pif1-like [Stemphylium lycopersici]|nr:atp-dependent dna helicase pif1-like [Stemphylium lycopersici]
MPPPPRRIAQTSTELKKQYKKNGPRLNERQQKQLERESELEQRAARAREAEERRKFAKKKREEKEAKEAAARKQIGVGLATQMIGYSHTQAQLKNGMEAFLGLKKKKDDEKRRKDLELTRKMEEIVENMEKEPWDDDDEETALELPESKPSLGEQWADEDLDDDSLLEAHDLAMSDPVEEPPPTIQPPPAPPAPLTLPRPAPPSPTKPTPAKDEPAFTRTHGPINKTIEGLLNKLPEPLIELLSNDLSLKVPVWDPAPGLLHKLNPIGLPPHRLRVKVGCVVTLLRDLNTSSQLSKSQHLRILRSDKDRLECLVLDGQLQGTKTFLTRVPFFAKYKNLDQHPFQRIQFPVRVATDYTPSSLPRDTSQAGFKLPSIPGRAPPVALPRQPVPAATKARPQSNLNPSFKLPGLPASKSSSTIPSNTTLAPNPPQVITPPPADCWDDFLESSTQISRELASETIPEVAEPNKTSVAPSPPMVDYLPPMSTQDLDFSLDDLDNEPEPDFSKVSGAQTVSSSPSKAALTPLLEKVPAQPTLETTKVVPTLPAARPANRPSNSGYTQTSINTPTRSSAIANSSRPLTSTKKIAGRCLNPGPFATGLQIELAKLRASQLPKSMSGPSAKRKAPTAPSRTHTPPAKKQCKVDSRPVAQAKPTASRRHPSSTTMMI